MPTYCPYYTIYRSLYSAGSFQVTYNLSNNPPVYIQFDLIQALILKDPLSRFTQGCLR